MKFHSHWIPVKNTTAETIPGGGLMRVIDPGQDEDGNWLVGKPNADGDTTVIVNGESEIPPNGYGQGHRDTMAVLLYDTTETRPLTRDLYGSKAGSWQAHIDRAGFRIDSAGNGRANAFRECGATSSGGLPRSRITIPGRVYCNQNEELQVDYICLDGYFNVSSGPCPSSSSSATGT